jgi:hypothetical protein
MRNRFLRSVVVGLVIFANTLLVASYAQGAESKVQYRQISMEDYRDKVAGGWIGQAIGAMDGVQMDWRNGAV